MWIKPDLVDDDQVLVQLQDAATYEGYYVAYYPLWDYMEVWITDGGAGYGFAFSYVPELRGEWHHLAVTIDEGDATILYLDGIELQQNGQMEMDDVAPAGPLTIGNTALFAGSGYHGLADELRFYDRELTGEEVSALAQGSTTAVNDFDVATGDHNRIASDGECSYTFDDQGNRTQRSHHTNGEVTDYTWDVRNRLVKVETTDNLERVHIAKESGGDGIVDLAGNLPGAMFIGSAGWTDSDLPPATGVDWAVELHGTPDAIVLGADDALQIANGELTGALWAKLEDENTYNDLLATGGFGLGRRLRRPFEADDGAALTVVDPALEVAALRPRWASISVSSIHSIADFIINRSSPLRSSAVSA